MSVGRAGAELVARPAFLFATRSQPLAMRAEILSLAEDIKQSAGLLRRHL
jgi:hypothetical protein